MVEKQDDGTTKPELACYEVDFTEEELDFESERLKYMHWDIMRVLNNRDNYQELPLCPTWMCGRESSKMIKQPYCVTCKKEFQTEWGIKKHTSSKTGMGHEVKPGEYEKEYIKACKWFDDCKPFGEGDI